MSTTHSPAPTTALGRFFTTEDLAARYRTSPSTIRYWRMISTGPVGVKYGRRVLYSAEAVAAYEAQRAQAQGGGAA